MGFGDLAGLDARNARQLVGVELSLPSSQPQFHKSKSLPPKARRQSSNLPLTASNPKDLAPILSTGRGHKRACSADYERRGERSSIRIQHQQQEERLRIRETGKESRKGAQLQGSRRQNPSVAGKGNTIQRRSGAASEGEVCASKAEQRPAAADDAAIVLDLADLGPLLGSGNTGRVYRWKSESENLAVKMFLEINSFNREYSAYQIMHAEATQIPPIRVPCFYEKVHLPQELLDQVWSFLDHRSNEDEEEEEEEEEEVEEEEEEVEMPPSPHGLILERLRGPILSQVLNPANQSLTSSYLIKLHESLRATLEAIHKLGIVHTDLKENNIMFLTEETTPDNCRMIDFGHAEFQSQLSSQSWETKCESDKADLHDVFCEAEARLAIRLGVEFLKSDDLDLSTAFASAPEEPLDAKALLDQYDHPRKEGNYLESLKPCSPRQSPESFQTRFAILLKFASSRALEATPLIKKILSLIPKPTDLLALSLVNILFDASRQKKALELLNLQLSNSSMHPLISVRFHERKIQYVIDGKCVWQAQISALKRAMPVIVAAYGKKSAEVLAAKYKLGRAYKLIGEEGLAREIYFESVSEFESIETESDGTAGRAVKQKVDSDQATENLLSRWRYEIEAL
ncbi:hypothetical protein WAI453_013723 [Rhynchosporium graminicola]